jgi:hypothetical protein
MNQDSILVQTSSLPAREADMPGTNTGGPPLGSVSAGIAAANALLSKSVESGPRFPGEDGGRSLAEMAHADLDATLQLLAERAQYITGAGGAAIALRRDNHKDMLCRASSGDNAPELGALLSMEYGLSGESVRTRQLMRCDDAERDPRVNRDVCRELGIASVLVMPILSDANVLGVFELFSATANAFDERDLSALLRLSEMVGTSVAHAASSLRALTVSEIASPAIQPPPAVPANPPWLEASSHEVKPIQATELPSHEPAHPKPEEAASASKRTLFWSAAMRAQSGDSPQKNIEALNVPPVLRNLQKCQACGFPVSQGRVLCVECEEKQWRREPPLQDEASSQHDQAPPLEGKNSAALADVLGSGVPGSPEVRVPNSAALNCEPMISPKPETVNTQELKLQSDKPVVEKNTDEDKTNDTLHSSPGSFSGAPSGVTESENSPGSTLQPQSWIASNKYILGALLIGTVVLAAIAWLR